MTAKSCQTLLLEKTQGTPQLGGRQVGPRMEQLSGADRGEEDQCGQAASKQLDPEVGRETSRSIRGTIAHRPNASRFARIVSLSPSPAQ